MIIVNPVWRDINLKCPCPHLDTDLNIIKKNLIGNDMDFVLVNEGREGSGKSNLALYQAWSVDPDFDLSTNYYKIDEYFKEIPNLNQKVVLIDEGGEMLNKRKWASADNIDINRILMASRFKNNLTIVNIPDYLMIDPGVRGVRVAGVFRTTYEQDRTSLLFKRGRFKAYSSTKAGMIRKNFVTGVKIYPRESYQEYLPSMERINPKLWRDYKSISKEGKTEIIQNISDRRDRDAKERDKNRRLERSSNSGSPN